MAALRALLNPAYDPSAVAAPSAEARAFHAALPGYAPTPLRDAPRLAEALGVARVLVKDESDRLGLPAFKILGASWAVERALRVEPGTTTLVAASAGNHGRAVARAAALRGLRCRIFLPARALETRRAAIRGEGAEVVVVDGSYEDAVATASRAADEPGAVLVADVGDAGPAAWVTDGYATLFAEAAEQGAHDLVVVPVGVGSLAAAAARHAAQQGVPVVGAEPATAACLTASLERGEPTPVATPGTTMAGLDCAEVSAAAWPALRAGITATVTVTDDEAARAIADLAAEGLAIGESGAATLAALRALVEDPAAAAVRAALGVGPSTRVLLIASEGPTGALPARPLSEARSAPPG